MPTYVYKFVDTGETIEVQQAFTDDTLTTYPHPSSGAEMAVKKVFQPVGVTFKGSGFYKTDSRGGSSKAAGDSASKDTGSDASASTDTGSGSSGGSADSSGSGGTSSTPSSGASGAGAGNSGGSSTTATTTTTTKPAPSST